MGGDKDVDYVEKEQKRREKNIKLFVGGLDDVLAPLSTCLRPRPLLAHTCDGAGIPAAMDLQQWRAPMKVGKFQIRENFGREEMKIYLSAIAGRYQ